VRTIAVLIEPSGGVLARKDVSQQLGRWFVKLISFEAVMDANQDYKDLLQNLSDARVRFLVVGAYAVMYHTEPRYTKDLDLWIQPTRENAARVWQALLRFGAPLTKVAEDDFANPETVFQIGIEPNRIDLITAVEGLNFEKAWQKRIRTSYDGLPIYVLSRLDLITNKKRVGRPQDLLDVRYLTLGAKKVRRKKKSS
jgi:hypothetical protein